MTQTSMFSTCELLERDRLEVFAHPVLLVPDVVIDLGLMMEQCHQLRHVHPSSTTIMSVKHRPLRVAFIHPDLGIGA